MLFRHTPQASQQPPLAFAGKFAARARGRLRSLAGLRHSLSVRLLSRVLLFSVCVTLVLTLLQLYVEYRQ
jgi:hypothetical protein